MVHILIDMFKYTAVSVYLSIGVVPNAVGMHVRLLPVPPVCRRGRKVYKVGQRFPAGDGCNTW